MYQELLSSVNEVFGCIQRKSGVAVNMSALLFSFTGVWVECLCRGGVTAQDALEIKKKKNRENVAENCICSALWVTMGVFTEISHLLALPASR